MSKRRFQTLDGLRGVAAVCIVVFHAHSPLRLYNLMPHAYLAVDFFFVLSGFVLSHGFNARLSDGSLGFVEFLVLRLKRLAPLNVAGALLGGVLAFTAAKWLPHELGLSHQPLWLYAAAFAASFLLLPVFARGSSAITPLNPPAWSLFFELVVNLIYAATARWLSKTVLAGACAVLFAGLVAYGAVFGTLDIAPPLSLIVFNAMSRALFGFSVGLLLHRLWVEGVRAPKAPVWALCVVLIVVFQIPGGPSPWRAVTDLVSVLAVLPAVVWFGASASGNETLMGESGEISYPIYALHFMPIIVSSAILDAVFHNKVINVVFLVVAVGVLIAGALLASHWDAWMRTTILKGRMKGLRVA